MRSLLLTLAVTLLWLAPIYAQGPVEIPAIVGKGLEVYRRDGALAAVNAWFTGSARETDGDAQDAAVARFSRVQSWLGNMTGFETVRIVPLSRSTERVYLALKYERGVAWMSFDCYRPEKEWIVTRFDFSTNANVVLPPNILGGQ